MKAEQPRQGKAGSSANAGTHFHVQSLAVGASEEMPAYPTSSVPLNEQLVTYIITVNSPLVLHIIITLRPTCSSSSALID